MVQKCGCASREGLAVELKAIQHMNPEHKNDGGPAFPAEYVWNSVAMKFQPSGPTGMSLRDWFAGQALNQMLRWEFAEGSDYDALADEAYKAADAMLAARHHDHD